MCPFWTKKRLVFVIFFNKSSKKFFIYDKFKITLVRILYKIDYFKYRQVYF